VVANPKLIAESLNNFFINDASDVVNAIPPTVPLNEQPQSGDDDVPLLSFY
jgi:hypothetical protein